MQDEGVADLAATADQLRSMTALSQAFGSSIAKSFAGGISEGRRFDDMLRSVGQSLQQIALKAAFKPLEGALSSGLNGLLGSALGNLTGMGGGTLPVQPFADGGVVRSPTYFPLGQGLGLAGEAGPEAILPLARGADGKLGVRAGGRSQASVTVNISTPDADSFRRSEAQVSAAIARAVAAGSAGPLT